MTLYDLCRTDRNSACILSLSLGWTKLFDGTVCVILPHVVYKMAQSVLVNDSTNCTMVDEIRW